MCTHGPFQAGVDTPSAAPRRPPGVPTSGGRGGVSARPVGVLQRECQRRVARTRAQHDIAHAAANQFVDDYTGLRSRWIHHYRLSAKNFRAAALTASGASRNPRCPVSGISR